MTIPGRCRLPEFPDRFIILPQAFRLPPSSSSYGKHKPWVTRQRCPHQHQAWHQAEKLAVTLLVKPRFETVNK